MKKIVIVLLILLNNIVSYSQILTVAESINKAGRQRMLSQRMAKDYILIGSGVKVEEATKELDDASVLFNESYNELVLFCKNEDVVKSLEFVDGLWKKYRQKVLSTPDIDTAASVIIDANNLTNACNVVVEKIVASSNSKKAPLPNICGRQRMLSQRMAMLYAAYSWQVPYKNLTKDLDTTINDFQVGLTTLTDNDNNTDEIKTILRLQISEWDFLKSSFDLNKQRLTPVQIFSSTNLVMKNFDRATKLYEKLL
ncbi:MAG: type IV pili methyl-accepting chemotaxis transducer N-terminal domain-containing protein [Flavobacterium sp.]|nr:type IV pili methyl-accepting chemotaxis transducer N-terminal domain-containing protein [Flavobacterium sp.]